ncbi:acVLRF1 family peptidyl-tRNA hydrolase [Nocardioides sp.]|uniref:acVLRF1 family peptidyl-tRNA hydrolase n=1 Tax=Nocardioides sp. TaxID=35761 RepID=UPI002ED28B78
MSTRPDVLVPVERLGRWVENFAARHGGVALTSDGALHGTAPDGSTFVARLPFDRTYGGPADPVAFAAAAVPPSVWGVLLVRKGGFAVARLGGSAMVEHKVGQRHVQGRTKAGGQSQQRFARRRDNQSREAYEAAAGHAARILRSGPLVTGGDHAAVDSVLADARLADLRRSGLTVVDPWLPVPDPRRRELDAAIADAQAVAIEVHNA